MKKIIVVIFLLFMGKSIFSQTPNEVKHNPNFPYRNTFSLVLQRSDMGYGFRYDRQLGNYKYGLYTTYSMGNYSWDDGNAWIKDHQRFSLGATKNLKVESEQIIVHFSAGFVYHQFGEQVGTEDLTKFNPRALDPVSCEIGTGCQFNRLNVKFRYDVWKQEASVDFGGSLNFVKNQRNKQIIR